MKMKDCTEGGEALKRRVRGSYLRILMSLFINELATTFLMLFIRDKESFFSLSQFSRFNFSLDSFTYSGAGLKSLVRS